MKESGGWNVCGRIPVCAIQRYCGATTVAVIPGGTYDIYIHLVNLVVHMCKLEGGYISPETCNAEARRLKRKNQLCAYNSRRQTWFN